MLGLGLPMPIERDIIPPWVLQGASIDLYFAKSLYYGASLSSALSVSRASTAYAQTASGLLVPFSANVPCITDLGLQVWEGRTNTITFSQGPSASWGAPTGATTTDAFGAAPDGTNTAIFVKNDSSTGQHFATPSTSGAPTSGTTSVSVYGKIAPGSPLTWCFVSWFNGAGFVGTFFQLTGAGAVGTSYVGATTNPTITAVANGWYRMSFQTTAAAGSSSIRLGLATANGTFSYTGDGTSGLLFWGAQVEAGSFPSPYIPTTTTSAARAADNITATGALLAAFPNSQSAVVQTFGVANLNSNRFWSAGSPGAFVVDATRGQINNGTVAATATLGSGVWTGVVKSAFGYNSTNASAVINNGTVGTQAGNFAQVAPVYIGSSAAASNWLNGYLQRLTVFNSRLPDATLKALTA